MTPEEAVQFLHDSNDAESTNRSQALDDLRFVSLGEQWPAQIQNSRNLENRPQLTMNIVDANIKQVTNNQRQQRPRGKVHPVNSEADPKIAEIINGIGRHVEVQSDADYAYDTAFNHAVRMGWGYFRLRTDYIDDKSFDQDIFIDAIDNPFTVYPDPFAVLPDMSDQTRCLISDVIPNKDFVREFGRDADLSGFTARGSGDSEGPQWVIKDSVRIAECYEVTRIASELVKLRDGRILFKKDLPRNLSDRQIEGTRPSWDRKVIWTKCTATEELDRKTLPGRWIPVVRVEGVSIVVNGKRYRYGLTRFAKDPARGFNFWVTAMTEIVALAPKAKWLVAEGTIEGHENEYSRNNQAANSVLYYKNKDLDGQEADKPERLMSEPPPEGAMTMAGAMKDALQSVMGIYDPNVGKPDGTDKSGVAIQSEQGQGEQANFDYYDNLTRSIRQAWRVMLNWVPEVYDTERVMRVIGDDGKPDLVTVNQPQPLPPPSQPPQPGKMGAAAPLVAPAPPPTQDESASEEVIHNNLTVGAYDVVMDTGPGYNTKRKEAQDAFVSILSGPLGETIAQKAADLVIRVFDFPEADMLADRLAAGNPLASIDEHSDIPPPVQMLIKELQAQVQDLTGKLQTAELIEKFKLKPAMLKKDTEDKRLLLDAAKFHDQDQTKRKDVDQRAATAEGIADKRMAVDLLMHHMGLSAGLQKALMDTFDNQSKLQADAQSQESDQAHEQGMQANQLGASAEQQANQQDHEAGMAQFQVDNAPDPAQPQGEGQ